VSVRYTYVTAFIPYWHNSLQRKKKQKKNKTRPAAKGFSLRHDKDFRVGTERKQNKEFFWLPLPRLDCAYPYHIASQIIFGFTFFSRTFFLSRAADRIDGSVWGTVFNCCCRSSSIFHSRSQIYRLHSPSYLLRRPGIPRHAELMKSIKNPYTQRSNTIGCIEWNHQISWNSFFWFLQYLFLLTSEGCTSVWGTRGRRPFELDG